MLANERDIERFKSILSAKSGAVKKSKNALSPNKKGFNDESLKP